MTRVAINGFGRIGRNIIRAWLEWNNSYSNLEIVAINDLGDRDINAHLLKYDSVHGTLSQEVSATDNGIRIGNIDIQCFNQRNPANLPWRELNIGIVLECTGLFTTRDKASLHLDAGAKKVLISAPGTEVDATIVYGVNQQSLTSDHSIISNASCTTNCLAPLAHVLHSSIGINKGMANTIHAYTNDQNLSDVQHSDKLRARSATQSMIPTKTGAASAVGLVLPELSGKLDGLAIRVPVINVSLLDFTFEASRETSVEEVNELLLEATRHSHNELYGILVSNEVPLVSIDFNHNPASSIVDLAQTKVINNLVKVLAWYDNEWGFSNRMLDTTNVLSSLIEEEVA